eukprot:m.503040 g.503040  ORF g.503040 m.503040 type:complete len:210 (+) comp57341_c0_seq39:78-707(+)
MASVLKTQGSQASLDQQLRARRERDLAERLLAYREDLAEWLANVFGIQCTEATLMQDIGTGVLLCRLAKLVDEETAKQKLQPLQASSSKRGSAPGPKFEVKCNERARLGTFQARDNIANFIYWGRSLGVGDAVTFEADDLVLAKNEKNVLYRSDFLNLAPTPGSFFAQLETAPNQLDGNRPRTNRYRSPKAGPARAPPGPRRRRTLERN